jgi:hypothetical protein
MAAEIVITGFTKDRMLIIENGTIVSGEVVGDNLILEKRDGTLVDAGDVRGPIGDDGPFTNGTDGTDGTDGADGTDSLGGGDGDVKPYRPLLNKIDERNLTLIYTNGVLTSTVEDDDGTTVKTTTLTYTNNLPTTVVEEVVTPEGTVTMTIALTYTDGLITGRTRTLT